MLQHWLQHWALLFLVVDSYCVPHSRHAQLGVQGSRFKYELSFQLYDMGSASS